jgi:hypothetical protein
MIKNILDTIFNIIVSTKKINYSLNIIEMINLLLYIIGNILFYIKQFQFLYFLSIIY